MTKRFSFKKKKRKLQYAKKIGQPPGSVIHLGEIKTARPAITLFDYNAEQLTEIRFSSLEESRRYSREHERLWLNVHGLHEASIMEEIGARFNLHPLTLEDIANTQQRPKIEDYGHYVFVVMRAFNYDKSERDAKSDQISLVLGKDFVLSFQEQPTGLFDPIRERLRKSGGLLRNSGSDALLHALVDAVVDRYFLIVESVSEEIEVMEEEVMQGRSQQVIENINHFKRETLEIRRAIWPIREVLNGLLRYQGSFLRSETQLYFRDVYDHSVHIIELVDALRDQIGDLLDIHLSSVSNRLNAELRVLTVVTTLFAPAALVTGFFGMNFEVLPLLDKPNGWLIAVLAILGMASVLIGILLTQRWWVSRS